MQQPDVNDLIMSVSKPIKWVVPDSIRTEHATNIVVQQRGSEFTILFFEVEPPLFTGTPEEQAAQYKGLEEVTAKCVAKVVMSAENTMEATNNLIEGINRFKPYMETTQELDLHMPPISSRRVTINVTDRGRAKPDLYIE